MKLPGQFSEAVVVDFEFHAPPGERPRPICMVAKECISGRIHTMWWDDSSAGNSIPFPTGKDVLIVAYYASAEMGCFLAANWPFPENVLDLFTEFRCKTNGRDVPNGNGLVGALLYHGLPALDVAEKESMRGLAMRGGPYSNRERQQLLSYCRNDVDSTCQLLDAMLPVIDLPRALLRGRYMRSVSRMEWTGVPIDQPLLKDLRTHWGSILGQLIESVDGDFHVFEGTSFKRNRFAEYLSRNGIPWPQLNSGELALDDDTFRQMAKRFPIVAPLRQLRQTLGELRLENLSVGFDGRNRCLLSPFRSRTSRNQPSNAKFIFGPSCWIRGLIKPPPGRAIAYVDWSQQEFAIAAALSEDAAMMDAYSSADPYLTFAKQAGAVPESATKKSHPHQREQFKVCALGVQYGMQSKSLAQALGKTEAHARELLDLHRKTYPRYWDWSQAAVDHAMIHNWLGTVFGWRVHSGSRTNVRGLANFPMQANGAEMLRLACCLATERGIAVCAPVHDALLIEGDIDSIDDDVKATQLAMLEAGKVVLGGFEVRSDAEIVRSPDRYMDARGKRMWSLVTSILHQFTDDSTNDIPSIRAGAGAHAR